MAQTITGISAPKAICNLDTYNHTCGNNSLYTVQVNLTMRPGSSLSIVIQQNGTPVAASAAPSSTQSHLDLTATINCVVNDVISIVISSSNAAVDGQLNVVKGILTIQQGVP